MRPRWTPAEAISVWNDLRDVYRENGYLLAVYGSALCDGGGRDLDLLAIPWRPNPCPPSMMESVLRERVCAKPSKEPPHRGLMKSWAQVYELPDRKLIDIQYRPSETSMEESYEYSMRVPA